MLRAIVGIEIAVERVQAKWKLGQNRSAADRAGVLAGLDDGGDAARALAALQRG
jgi:transcriptional regulator